MNLNKNLPEEETIEQIRRENIPVIIFGAGIVGEVLFHACSNSGIKVQCFCDNNINKTQYLKCNLEVIHTADLKKKYKDAIFLISAADIKDVVEQLRISGYSKWYASNLLLRNFDLYQYQFTAPADFVEYAVNTCLLCHDSYLNPDKLFLRSVDIVITERCSLKCANCSNLMQYYKKPVDYNIKELIQTIDAFCTFIDEINEFRVIGGEPFMNKEFHLLIKRLIPEEKVKKIVIYTNGTIVPEKHQIEYLKSKKIMIIITDYGILSKKLKDLTEILEKNNIPFYESKARGWTDCARIMKHYRNREDQKEIFKDCCAKNLATLSKGKLYRCPFAANAFSLLAVPDCKNDYIDIWQDTQVKGDINDMKKKIRTYLLEKDYLETCDYCNGRPFTASEIVPAIQTKKPLEYEVFQLKK